MSKYQKLLKEIETLKEKAAEERKKEIADVVADIKAKMAQYDLTPSDLGFPTRSGRKAATKIAVAPKYRDPATGKTWSGRGRAPKWIAAHEDKGGSREDFAIR